VNPKSPDIVLAISLNGRFVRTVPLDPAALARAATDHTAEPIGGPETTGAGRTTTTYEPDGRLWTDPLTTTLTYGYEPSDGTIRLLAAEPPDEPHVVG
jgi:hypothetical protein